MTASLNWILFTWNYNWKSLRINLNCCNHDTINHLQNNYNRSARFYLESKFSHCSWSCHSSNKSQVNDCSSVLYGNTSQAASDDELSSISSLKDKMFNVSEMIIQSMFCPISSADKPGWWWWCCCNNSKCILISSLSSWSATDIFWRKQDLLPIEYSSKVSTGTLQATGHTD